MGHVAQRVREVHGGDFSEHTPVIILKTKEMKVSLNRIGFLIMVLLLSISGWSQTEKSRLIVMADMGNEPDEMQQMMHLLMYSNEIDIEGLISVT